MSSKGEETRNCKVTVTIGDAVQGLPKKEGANYECSVGVYGIITVFDYPKNLTLLTPSVRKCWVPRYWLFVLTTVFGEQRSICHEVNTCVKTGVNYFNPLQG